MSKFEIAQLIIMYRAATADDHALFLSILFRFLVVTSLFGKKLSRVHITGLRTVYSFFAGLVIFGTDGNIQETQRAFLVIGLEIFVLGTQLGVQSKP